MQKIWLITSKEIQAFFDSLIAYVLLALFLGLSGFFTWVSGSDVFFMGEASLSVFFNTAFWTLFFFVPTITMGSIAEEKASGNLEMLMTKGVSDWQLVLGKFLAAWLLVLMALCLTLPYYFTLTQLGNVDHGAVLGGYLGLMLLSAGYVGFGIFASSLSENQIIAILAALFFTFFFQYIFGALGVFFEGRVWHLLYFLSVETHFTHFAKGVLDLKSFAYFFTMAFLGIFLAQLTLAGRHVR